MQGEANKRKENRRRKLYASSSTIADAIKKISTSVKKIEKMMMEMTERITTHILQREQIDRELIEQGQLQMAALFVEYLKSKNS
jgi:uncharacterized protein YoxC